MAAVKVHDTPQEAAKPAAPTKETVTDSKGRVITLRELDPLQQARLVMAVGGDVAANPTYMNGFALPAAMVESIDDEFFGFPGSVPQIEAMLKQLGTEGMASINAHLMAKFEAAKAEMEKVTQSTEQAAAKN